MTDIINLVSINNTPTHVVEETPNKGEPLSPEVTTAPEPEAAPNATDISKIESTKSGMETKRILREEYNIYHWAGGIAPQVLSDIMCSEDADSISIEEINSVLHGAARNGDSKGIQAIFDGASRCGEEMERKLLEAKSMRSRVIGLEKEDQYEAIPGMFLDNPTLDTLKLLLEGVKLEDDGYNTRFGSMLHWAMKKESKVLFEYLVKSGYPLYKEDSEGLTALNRVSISGTDWAGIMLLEANIDVNNLNQKGFSSIHYAVKHLRFNLMKELIRHGADIDIYEEGRTLSASVESRDCELMKYLLERHKFNTFYVIMDPGLTSAVNQGQVPMIELLLEEVSKHDPEYPTSPKLDLLKEAILSGKVSSLITLFSNGAKITFSGLKDAYEIWHLSKDKIACLTLPYILKHWGVLGKDIFRDLIELLIDHNFYRCAEIVIKYISDNKMLDITEEMKRNHDLLERAGSRSEEIFLLLLNFVSIESIQRWPQVCHELLDAKYYKGLKVLMDNSVEDRGYRCHLKFLSSTFDPKTGGFIYPQYYGNVSQFVPSFLHKLNSCPDPKIKYHPIVNAAVEDKLHVYRWWYVLTFLLYSIFLSILYYALFEASYQCDDMLFIYIGISGRFRAVCEAVVLIYAIIFTIDEGLEFGVYLSRYSLQEYKTRNLFRALYAKDYDFYGHKKGYYNLRHFLRHLPSLLKKHFGVFNSIDIFGLVSLFLLVIFRLSGNPFQWTLASFTIILFTLRLFKYTRIIPSLGAYVRSVFQIFIHDITQFAVIIIIFMLAYFGGIHLAARQAFVSSDATTPPRYSENCSNNSLTGLFWFDQERTSSYDLRRPLLSGIIFLLDGGPGNEESALLDSNFLFTLLYLSFAFTIIVVMSNILIAQLSQTYAKVTHNGDLPFKFDLVVSVEYESNLAFFFGAKLRSYTHRNELDIYTQKWKNNNENGSQEDILLIIENTSEAVRKDVKENISNVKEEISNVKEDILNLVGDVMHRVDTFKEETTAIEKRMDRMEGLMMEILDAVKNPTPTSK